MHLFFRQFSFSFTVQYSEMAERSHLLLLNSFLTDFKSYFHKFDLLDTLNKTTIFCLTWNSIFKNPNRQKKKKTVKEANGLSQMCSVQHLHSCASDAPAHLPLCSICLRDSMVGHFILFLWGSNAFLVWRGWSTPFELSAVSTLWGPNSQWVLQKCVQ